MAFCPDLYLTPARRLDAFVAQELQPDTERKEEIEDVFKRIEGFLRDQCFHTQLFIDREVKVKRVVKGGSCGKGTTLSYGSDVDLVIFLSCFYSFREQAKLRGHIISHVEERLTRCRKSLAFDIRSITVRQNGHRKAAPRSLSFYIQAKRRSEPIKVNMLPAFDALGNLAPDEKPPSEVYENLINSQSKAGEFSSSFTELQRNFFKHRPAKLKALLRLVKHWYMKKVKAKCPRTFLPPKYALELLTVHAWEMGTQKAENFRTDEGFVTVMELLRDYENICIYWTTNYNFQNAIVRDFVKQKLKKTRPIILDPADPTNNVGEGRRWDLLAQEATYCLKQDCCYDENDEEITGWGVQGARNVQVVLRQSDWENWTLWVNPYDQTWKMKETIKQERALTGQLRLSFQDPSGERQLLRGSDTLAQYGIFYRIVIYLLETFSPEIQIFVKGPDNHSKVYAADPDNYIQDLKQKIEDARGPPMECQVLEFEGQRLRDYKCLRDYGIQDSDTIIMSKR
ncbi:2'-5'-oligoadenylate synthase-like protein 2 [Dromiciops gliroides]|uniref:2'-5'-oligoadenylate synthase-like protein 2 n=1 Tax=Dromiciops gliroides TaxID=33562 RepID=UPI001CC44AE9|nr:2'-5'-oligoadenylate synthase-like protein 2 [Dromiciops gliroides]